MSEGQLPTTFISYSWEGKEHKEWVKRFATRLRSDGVATVLDEWHVAPGDQLPSFMERAIAENDFVLIVCTPTYKAKSQSRTGGVGYEGDIMTAEVLSRGNHRKFIPILRLGDVASALPSWLLGKFWIDLRGVPYDEDQYRVLISALQGEQERPPPVLKRGLRPLDLLRDNPKLK